MKPGCPSPNVARLMTVVALLGLALPLAPARGARPSSLSDAELTRIQFDQKLNAQVSLDLIFRDETGRPVRLGDCLGNKPTILVPGYYGCPMLCTLVLNGLVDSLLDLKFNLGQRYRVVNLSIDPTEKPELAAAKKRTYLKRYGRPGAAEGWCFLTGDEPAIRELTRQVGFHYAYDPATKQYAHPSGIIVLTPQGKVACYFFGLEFPPQQLANALRDAGREKVGSPIDQLILLCFHYSPLRGRYGSLIIAVLRVAGTLTVLALGVLLVRAARKSWGRTLVPEASRFTAGSEDRGHRPRLRGPAGEVLP